MKHTHRLLAVAAGVAITAGTLSGCSVEPEAASSGASQPAAGTVDKILFDYPFTALPVYAALTEAATAYAEEKGVELVLTNDNMDLSTQVSQLTTHLGSDVDAVVSFPMDNASVETVAKQYLDAGKHWITYGGDLENQTTSLQFSFEESGRMLGENAGQWAEEALGGEGTALVLVDETIQLGQERTQGLLDALAETAPDLEIIQQQAVTPDEGLSVTSAVLAQHPDVSIVVAAVGDAAAGAYQALAGAGRAADDAETYVGGLDGNLTLFQEMKKGSFVRAVVTIDSLEIARAVIDVPLALGEGESDERFDVPVYMVTPDSADLDDYIASFGG
ncbi:substrate-binding domain-containing protein [Microbacterium sp.]|uniref:sugar ABC transporter substrate-binding protein n=1 Tax=Microbacterium sp. TaxID=51671 RepID=UPI0028110A9C|nr:substrate-binding domain-containing protein [Microbacterium sp.]